MANIIDCLKKTPRIPRGNDFKFRLHLTEDVVVGNHQVEQREIQGTISNVEVKLYRSNGSNVAKNAYNDFVVAEVFPIGISVKNYVGNNCPKALVSGNKGYHCLVYNSDCNLDEGEMVFWSWRYRFEQDIVM